MENFTAFLKNSWEEVTKNVTWPSWGDLQSSAALVLVASLIFALIIGLMDFAISNGLDLLYKSF